MSWMDEALEYLEMGWTVIPLHQTEKRPLVKWKQFQDRQPTEEELLSWERQWPEIQLGLVTGAGSGVVVIDCDNEEAYNFAASQGWTRSCAMRVQTKRGWHLYFLHPGGKVKCNAGVNPGSDWFAVDGLDIRGDGGYVVLPTGKNNYTWVADIDIHDWRDELQPWMKPAVPSFEEITGLDLTGIGSEKVLEDEWRVTERYVLANYPDTMKLPTGKGNGRNERVFRYLSQQIMRGIMGAQLDEVGREFMEHFYQDPLEESYYQATLRSVWEREINNHPERFDQNGNYTYRHPSLVEMDYSNISFDGPDVQMESDLFLTEADAERLIEESGNRAPLVNPWLQPSSITQVYGYTGHGKSTMLYRILYHLSCGRTCGPFEIERPAKILYLDWENGKSTLGKHLRGMRRAYGGSQGNFRCWIPGVANVDDLNLRTPEGLANFRELLMLCKPEVVVIDTVRSAFTGLLENSAEEWAELNQLLLKLRNWGTAVIYVHHANKQTKEGLGSSAGNTNQLTVVETQLRVTQVYEYADDARAASGIWAGSYQDNNPFLHLRKKLPEGGELKAVFELSYGKVREWTEDHERKQFIGLAKLLDKEIIVSSSSPRQQAYQLFNSGASIEQIAMAIRRTEHTVEHWLSDYI